MKKLLSFLLAIVLLANLSVALTSCGNDVEIEDILTDEIIDQMTPTIEISDDGYWVINGIKTETKAIATDGANGTDGVTPTIDISSDGYWVINGTKTEHKAIGTDGAPGATGAAGAAGATPTIEISSDGYWVINGTKTEHKAIGTDGAPGATGAAGATPTIKISSDGYWVINGTKTEYKAVGTDGAPGEPGTPGTPGTSTTPTAKNVTITFNADNGTALTTQTVAAGSKVTKPADPTKEGYAFGGWYVGDEKWSFIGYCATEDLTLTAKWNELYTVEFYSMDELLSPTFSFEYGTYLNPPEIPEVEGYELLCWYTVDERGYEYEWDFKRDFVCEDTKLYAYWEIKSYKVTFIVDTYSDYEYAYHGESLYYFFVNYLREITETWTLPDGTVWDFDNDVVTSDIYLTAQFPANYTYNTVTSTMPIRWNVLNYFDANDKQIMNYIDSSFFSYDYKFENDQKFLPDGSLNRDGIVDGAFTVNYDAATKLEDVTSSVDAKWGYTADQKAEGGYAWKITLRTDLKWDDGTPINAHDFVYSMQAQLDPDFMHYKASHYLYDIRIKNAKEYYLQNTTGTYESVASLGYTTNQEAIDAGKTLYVDIHSLWDAEGYTSEDGQVAPQWVAIDDATIYYSADGSDHISGAMLWGNYNSILDPTGSYASYVAIFVENTIREFAWSDVGMYAVDDYSFVICLDKAYSFLTEYGDLSMWAAYDLSYLPLVHRALYEACKQPPAYGSSLWTTTYNTSLATTASWGPYKLVEFDYNHYKLVKNENWYGYSMETNKGQYNITSIYCSKVEAGIDQWSGFLAGEYDDAIIGSYNIDEYLDSMYLFYNEGSTGTYGMQLYSNLEVLKYSDNNNGILAIREFRQAFNLALNRSDIIEKIWPGTATPCFGLVNSAYYYDVENAPNLADGGKYRNTAEAKEGILRAYGYTQGTDGMWSINNLTDMTLDEAYETLTGYNLELAREKMRAAIAELEANAAYYGYDSSKNITLVYGTSQDTDWQRFRANYLQGVLDTLTAGTSLEGRITVRFESWGSMWAEAFRSGATQIGFGFGFSGNAFNPFDIIGTFVNPDDSLNYHPYWDTGAINLTLTMPAGSYAGAGQTITMSAQNWYFCLNGIAAENGAPRTFNWDAGFAPTEVRLMILSALEELVIKESRSIMLIADSGGSFLGAQFSYFSDDYNTFMSYSGVRYMIGEYTDEEWETFVQNNDYDLSHEYKKSE